MLPWLDPDDDTTPFPALETALNEPNGLLAAGGSLRPERLLEAYRRGIFPWFEDDQPILWWSPNPRMVLKPSEIHISKSLRKTINKELFSCTIDTCFSEVIRACSKLRDNQDGTWITASMIQAYESLFENGHAHSIEVWSDEVLVGGLYGISIGQVFFGESMFSRKNNASKVAFAFLSEKLSDWGYQLIDAQVQSNHLETLGAYSVSREIFAEQIALFCSAEASKNAWLNT
ncbi:MAG: leucyl/phenylalanyl-tRNA--protein transferase [Cycloclasticus sp.]